MFGFGSAAGASFDALEQIGGVVVAFGLVDGVEHTQKEAADALGISQSYISRLEKRIIRQLKEVLERE